jgi:hypothetical protein
MGVFWEIKGEHLCVVGVWYVKVLIDIALQDHDIQLMSRSKSMIFSEYHISKAW